MSRASLTPERWQRIDALLDEALQRDEDERAAWLAAQCGDDHDLRQRVLDLLRRAQHEAPWESALQAPELWRELESTLATDGSPPPDARCGTWRLLQPIGRGGMADVFLAERESGGVTLRAAVKRLRPGRHDGEIERRFEREGRILARLQDERIARLLDAGLDADGRAWLATELIEGERIDLYCRRLALDLDARLALFLDVAAAVAVAHRQLIVHRDIKPANVLVTRRGRVKLLDFGIAKLLHDSNDLDARPDDPPTRAEIRLMTPEYAAPEQLLSHPVGTATDVYQLGLLLYELLTGVRPFVREGRTPAEFEHAVVNQLPAAPSTVAQAIDARATRRLRRRLHGDLDAVILTTLGKSPDTRYVSVDALISDLERWAGGRAVQARRVGGLRRTQLFVRRHALAVSTALLVVLSLVGYAMLATLQLRALEREAQLNLAVREYLSGLFRGADPRFVRGRALDADAVLVSGLAQARTRFADQPLLLSELLGIGADIRSGQADYATALGLIEEAVRLRRAHSEADDPRLGWALELLGRTLHFSGRYAEAEVPLREAIGICERARTSRICPALASAADLMQSRGDYAQAETLLRRALERIPIDSPVRSDRLRELADVLRDAGRFDEAGSLYREAIADLEARYDELHLSLAAARVGYARLLVMQGDAAPAAQLALQALQAQQQHFPDGHPLFGISRHALAQAQSALGELEAANTNLDQVLARDLRDLPPRNVLLAYAHGDRGWLRLARGDVDGARRDFDAAVESYEAVSGRSHPRLAEVLIGHAVLARLDGERPAAAELLDAARRLRVAAFGSGHPSTRALDAWRDLLQTSGAAPPRWLPFVETQRMRWSLERLAPLP
jgi:tetratricopeptide (TPR) repeat protein/tRNA A-37 threonylcarbamoyl transferase component Bud32